MKIPLSEYIEIDAKRRNTLQVFITNKCNLNCDGCFSRKIKSPTDFMSATEYSNAIKDFVLKEGEQVNILGGEPLLHNFLKNFIAINMSYGLKTTVYSNGTLLHADKKYKTISTLLETEGGIKKYMSSDSKYSPYAKYRISLYGKEGGYKDIKSICHLAGTYIPIDICFMVSKKTTVEELVDTANIIEKEFNCKVFFISSIRELDNEKQDFFEDTSITMPVIDYKNLVHDFLNKYKGNMEIHISKRGVFESTTSIACNKCRFANYFIGGKIIQCPYDTVNLKYQDDYDFGSRFCQHNNSCLMSKIILKRK